MLEDFLWVEKYRPKTVEDTILPADLKATFQQFVEQKNVPNLILTGGPGVGKTTIAKAMLEELGCTYIVINGSMNGNIDTLRNELKTLPQLYHSQVVANMLFLTRLIILIRNLLNPHYGTSWKSFLLIVVLSLLAIFSIVSSPLFTADAPLYTLR